MNRSNMVVLVAGEDEAVVRTAANAGGGVVDVNVDVVAPVGVKGGVARGGRQQGVAIAAIPGGDVIPLRQAAGELDDFSERELAPARILGQQLIVVNVIVLNVGVRAAAGPVAVRVGEDFHRDAEEN